MEILKLVANAKGKKASDIHLSCNSPPMIRVDGLLQATDNAIPLTEADVQQAFHELSSPDKIDTFYRNLEMDFSYNEPDGTRLRCSVAQQRGSISMTIRILTPEVPTIDELELPEIYKKFALMQKGLIVVSGPTGSGKTTTQAAMVQHINLNASRHILTFEDPIEYSHPSIKSRITQRELGGDTHSMSDALKHALRLDPDVIVVGEMRDSETAAAAISMAETGHLVITTSHASYATQTVERIIDLFPHEQRHLAQMRLASLLSVVLCQTLVPRGDGCGRIAAVEIMQVNSALRNLIRDGKITALANVIRDYRQAGNITLDEALVNLYRQGIISIGTVASFCHDSGEVNNLLTDLMIKPSIVTHKPVLPVK